MHLDATSVDLTSLNGITCSYTCALTLEGNITFDTRGAQIITKW